MDLKKLNFYLLYNKDYRFNTIAEFELLELKDISLGIASRWFVKKLGIKGCLIERSSFDLVEPFRRKGSGLFGPSSHASPVSQHQGIVSWSFCFLEKASLVSEIYTFSLIASNGMESRLENEGDERRRVERAWQEKTKRTENEEKN